jgi:hypothetical protein
MAIFIYQRCEILGWPAKLASRLAAVALDPSIDLPLELFYLLWQ